MDTQNVVTKYSQREEQEYILKAVGSEPGRFLDIGSWDPFQFSNTRALFELGWRGVMVEPSPVPFTNLLKEYGNNPRVQLINAAVGFERGLTEFHLTADGLSTSQEENYQRWKQDGGFVGKAWVGTIPLKDIFLQFGAFDMVSIDTEGTSADLFLELMKVAMTPLCICVEHDGRHVECGQAAQARGYKQYYVSGENIVFGR